MGVLAAADLACVRADRIVFTKLAFSVDGGGALRLTGPNGSGKSSLLRLLAGFLKPAKGALTWDGAPIDQDWDAHRARLAYVGHAVALKPALTVRETLLFWARVFGAGRSAEAAADRGLDAFGLAGLADFPVRLLSSGQRRRLALGRLLAAPGAIWLLDEPTTGLDSASVGALETAIAAHREAGGMVVLATHTPVELPDADTLALERFAVRAGRDG